MARAAGSHFFDRGTMKFFRSRVLPTVYTGPGGVYFVTSEQFNDTSARRFTVRAFDPAKADINTLGEFNEMGRAEALALARRAAKASPALCLACAGEGSKNGRPCWKCQRDESAAA